MEEPPPNTPMVIVGSALNTRDKRALQQVCTIFNAAGVPCSVGKAVLWGVTTHVVVGSHAQDANSSMRSAGGLTLGDADRHQHLARRTIKYCAAVLCGVCIVSANWLHAVVAQGGPLFEGRHLITGDHVAQGAPAMARAALWGEHGAIRPPAELPRSVPRRLFSGIVFLLAEEELRPSGTAAALSDMIQQGGGEVLRLQAGRPNLKRARHQGGNSHKGTSHKGTSHKGTSVEATRSVHVSDVKFPAALTALPDWVPSPASGVVGTTTLLTAVSRYDVHMLVGGTELA